MRLEVEGEEALVDSRRRGRRRPETAPPGPGGRPFSRTSAWTRRAGHALGLQVLDEGHDPVVGGEAEEEPAGPRPRLHGRDQAAEDAVEAQQLVHQLLAVRTVGVADGVGGREPDREEVGGLVGAEVVGLGARAAPPPASARRRRACASRPRRSPRSAGLPEDGAGRRCPRRPTRRGRRPGPRNGGRGPRREAVASIRALGGRRSCPRGSRPRARGAARACSRCCVPKRPALGSYQ